MNFIILISIGIFAKLSLAQTKPPITIGTDPTAKPPITIGPGTTAKPPITIGPPGTTAKPPITIGPGTTAKPPITIGSPGTTAKPPITIGPPGTTAKPPITIGTNPTTSAPITIGTDGAGAPTPAIDPPKARNPSSGSLASGDIGDEMDNDAFIKNFDEAGYNIACEWMAQSDPEKLKLNLNREITYEDACKLTFLNKGRKLDEIPLDFPEDIKWKTEIIDQMFGIYDKVCPHVFVRTGYLSIMRNLILIYLNSVEPRESPDQEVWTSILSSLVECHKAVTPYNFTSAGLKIVQLIKGEGEEMLAGKDDDTVATGDDTSGKDGGGDNGGVESGPEDNSLLDLQIQMENAEMVFQLDTIIDNLWYVFSHAWGKCLKMAPSRELWGPRFKQLFFRDFLAPLEDRWVKPGDVRAYLDVIVGDYDVGRMQANIPYCTQAAYINPKGTHLESQLVRPVRLTDIDKGVSKFQNTRV